MEKPREFIDIECRYNQSEEKTSVCKKFSQSKGSYQPQRKHSRLWVEVYKTVNKKSLNFLAFVLRNKQVFWKSNKHPTEELLFKPQIIYLLIVLWENIICIYI